MLRRWARGTDIGARNVLEMTRNERILTREERRKKPNTLPEGAGIESSMMREMKRELSLHGEQAAEDGILDGQ